MKRPKRAGSLSQREFEEYIWKGVRKKERIEQEDSRERTDTEEDRGGRGRTEQCADDRGVPWRDGNVRHGPAQMIGECRGAI